jgi:alpha-beta hydrolase superfamily lysophospholipase
MPDETLHVRSDVDGFDLTVYRWRAAAPRAVVVIAHGAAEHALRYERFAWALNAAGFDTWAQDHRGHGASPGPDGLGDFGEGGWDALVADIGQVIGLAKAAKPGLPVVLFGHSMGASAAQQFAPDGSTAIDALVLSGSTMREVPPPGSPPPVFEPNKPFEPARTPYDWLSRDEAEVDKYVADPFCGFEIWGEGRRTTNRADPAKLADPGRLARIRPDLPVLLLAGDADPINRNLEGLKLLEDTWRAAGVQRIDRLFYAGGRHEMLNETNRDEVTADVIAWLSSTAV